jgi:hypothetical protein
MTASGEVQLFFGDGEYVFVLKGKQLEELERCIAKHFKASGIEASPSFGSIADRIRMGAAFVREYYETIRLGLIGGGMPPIEATTKVDTYMYMGGTALDPPNDPASPIKTAQAVMRVTCDGLDEFTAEKKALAEAMAAEAASESQTSEHPFFDLAQTHLQ